MALQSAPTAQANEQITTDVPQSEIIVDAPASEAERRRELREMVTSIVRPARSGQTVGTFFDAICPKVTGLPTEISQGIEARMRLNAEQLTVNRRTPKADCSPNVSVIFVRPQDGPPESWLSYNSPSLKHLLSFQRRRVLNETGPVRSWVFSTPRSRDGRDIPNPGEEPISQAVEFANRPAFATRIGSPVTVEITDSVVLIELESAFGKTIEQLADYATIRSLANIAAIEPGTIPAAPTILTLFQDDEPPEGLTVFDRAFLTGLYDAPRTSLEDVYYNSITATALRMEQEESSRKLSE